MSVLTDSLLRRTLAFSVVIEIATGLALMMDPALVTVLLLGTGIAGVGASLGRCFGIALVALGIACWPRLRGPMVNTGSVPAMLLYNALIALYLAYVGIVDGLHGLLLWPAVGLHAAVALLLGWKWQTARVDP